MPKGQVWKRVWKMGVKNYIFGLRSGQDLENRPAYPPPRIPRSTPPPPARVSTFWTTWGLKYSYRIYLHHICHPAIHKIGSRSYYISHLLQYIKLFT